MTASQIKSAFESENPVSVKSGIKDKIIYLKNAKGHPFTACQNAVMWTYAGWIKVNGKTTHYKSEDYFYKKIAKLTK